MWLFDILRLRQQAPTTRPPRGYYDLRVSKTTGQLVLVDSDGAETAVGAAGAVGAVTSVAGRTGDVTLASADISDATADGSTNKGKLLKTGAIDGRITVDAITLGSAVIVGSSGLQSWAFPPGAVGGNFCRTTRADGFPVLVFPPTSDPNIAGALWNNGGEWAISAGQQ